MQVVCTQCHAVCDLDAQPSAASKARQLCVRCSAPLSLPAVVIEPEAAWLVLMPTGQAGPFSASHMAQLFDQANVDWTSLVWRTGLKGWRPARRDPQLVTAVASARGSSSWGDTQRVSPRRSLLPVTDTIVDSPPGLPPPAARFIASSWNEDSGENATQTMSQSMGRAIPSEPTFADSFRSAPAILATAAVFDAPRAGVVQRRSSPNSWLPSAQSMALVAVVAFGFGVLAAALWGRVARAPSQRAATMVVRPAQPVAPAVPTSVAQVAQATGPATVAVTSIAVTPSQAVPSDEQLRREVKRVSPDIRRCVDNLSRGAEIEIYFDGPSGRARDVRFRTTGLTPGRVACITQAARQMQVEPFSQPTHKFWHRFSY